MTNNIPYLIRNKIPTLLVLSAAAIALMLTSPMLFFNVLLQPVQAQTELTFRTPTPANGTYTTGKNASITFDAQGGTFTNPKDPKILETNGTFQITNLSSGQILSSGSISRVEGYGLTNTDPNSGLERILFLTSEGEDEHVISTSCGTSANNDISVQNTDGTGIGDFSGPVECSSSQGGGNTTSSSMTGTITTRQDSDGDGIPDSSDDCTHNSNPRCFKEGDTTAQQQQPSSSSNSTGNQIR